MTNKELISKFKKEVTLYNKNCSQANYEKNPGLYFENQNLHKGRFQGFVQMGIASLMTKQQIFVLIQLQTI